MEKDSIIDKDFKCKLDQMFSDQGEHIESASRALKVLAHPARLKILCVLKEGEQNVRCLEEYTGLAQATLSQHLSILKDRGVLVSKRNGNFSYYSVKNQSIVDLFMQIQQTFCQPTS
ncbi:MAG: winged helix-turn-helix transcriptional regulator [Candidatus Cloacimonetes bacterium]|nr:winged helix-turn-helix transcriptional regulator [Candidatus Cloacimonadota bacterium]